MNCYFDFLRIKLYRESLCHLISNSTVKTRRFPEFILCRVFKLGDEINYITVDRHQGEKSNQIPISRVAQSGRAILC